MPQTVIFQKKKELIEVRKFFFFLENGQIGANILSPIFCYSFLKKKAIKIGAKRKNHENAQTQEFFKGQEETLGEDLIK